MEIRVKVDEKFMKRLQQNLEEEKATEITREALALLNWAAGEAKAGRVILSSDKQGGDVRRLCMPKLEELEATAL